ncbi:GerAB/ArcD/ProY family transporter [Bacillus sp. z60-18]|uniref:GerAB/ArcD/ProY family transporter n=1 Tax=unclassified Bacillus (in: firmicutes) TaxID=185979 RepID=UPI00390CD8A7
MENAKISPHQLFSLIVLFVFGTALIVPLGVEAKQDAWLAELLGLAGGIVILFLYYYLYRQFPNMLLTRYIQNILGKPIGFIIGLLYIVFFIYGASRDLRDASELLLLQYGETPMFTLSVIMMVIVCYALYQGIETLARASEIMFALIFVMTIVTFFSIIGSNVIRLEHLLPVLENGWMPVVTTAFPERVFFPYGELICFTTIFPYLNQQKIGMAFGLAAIIFSGLVLTATIILEIAVLGVHGWGSSTFPFLKFVEKINFGGFIQGLQGVAMIALVVGDFVKVTIFSYAAVVCSADIFHVKKASRFILPIGLVTLALSIVIAGSYAEHIEQGKAALHSIFPLFAFMIPLLLVIASFVRKRIAAGKQN